MSDLPTASPAGMGVDARAVEAFVAAIDARPDLELHGFLLARHGHVVARGWWHPYGPELPHLLYSCSKTFTALAYAFAEAEGLLGRDQPLIEHWPEHAGVAGPRASRWTPRMLLRMASGHTTDWMGTDDGATAALNGAGDADAVAIAFASEPDREPGSVWCYNQLCTYLLAATVEKLTGERLVDYLRPRLFEPFGVDAAHWQSDNRGRTLGFTGLHVRLDALLKLGQLHLQRGVWDGRRLLPEAWFDEASQPLSDTTIAGETATVGTPAASDWAQGYGYQLWVSRHGYRADGALGQFSLVLPEQDAVLAIHAQTTDMQGVLDLVWDVLLPGVGDDSAGEGERGGERRGERGSAVPEEGPGSPLDFDALSLPAAGGAGPGGSFEVASGTYDSAWGVLAVPVTRLDAAPAGDGWSLSVATDDGGFEVPAGNGSWVAHVVPGPRGPLHLRSSAGWVDGRFRAELRCITTPHVVELVGEPAASGAGGGRLQSRWTTPPLRGVRPLDLGLPD